MYFTLPMNDSKKMNRSRLKKSVFLSEQNDL